MAEKWIAKSIIEHLNNDGPSLHPMQFMFRSHHSTETAASVLIKRVKRYSDSDACVSAALVERTTVPTIILSSSGFLLLTFLVTPLHGFNPIRPAGHTVCIKSPFLHCPLGVPQSSTLGPSLFSLYINNLPNICGNVDTMMFADDTVIFTHAKTYQEAAQKLSTALTHMYTWLTDSSLSLNTRKKVYLRREELQNVTEIKYLGVILDSTLSFSGYFIVEN